MLVQVSPPSPPAGSSASFVERLLLADPTIEVQLALIVFHIVLWWWIFKVVEREAPPRLQRCEFYQELSTHCWRQLPPGPVERAGFDTQYGYIVWLFVAIHHTVSGSLILFSYLYDDGGVCFRHGTLIAVGGIDLLQVIQLIFRFHPFHEALPPGSINSDGVTLGHHMFGILAILPANLLLSTDKDVQLVGVAGLFASAFTVWGGLHYEVIEPSKKCNEDVRVKRYWDALRGQYINLVVFCFFRWYLFPLHAYKSIVKFFELSTIAGVSSSIGIATLSVFNVIAVFISIKNIVDLHRAGSPLPVAPTSTVVELRTSKELGID